MGFHGGQCITGVKSDSTKAQPIDPPFAAAIAEIGMMAGCGQINVDALLVAGGVPETTKQNSSESNLNAKETALALAANNVSVDDNHGFGKQSSVCCMESNPAKRVIRLYRPAYFWLTSGRGFL